jgi:cholesterol transport system auxiliary component
MSGARLFKAALAGACLVGLSGCVSLLPEPTPVSVYRLSSPEPLEWSGQDWTIVLIEQPRAPRGLSGDEIAVLRNGQSLAYVSGARWISPVPGLLQNQVIDTFNAASSGLAPARPEDGVRADYELRLDLREYEADYDRGAEGAPLVRVRLAARLVSERGRNFIGARVFTAEVRASANRTGAIVNAFDAATGTVTHDLSRWTAAQIAAQDSTD